MVNVIATSCDGCGKSLDPREEPRDLAHVSDSRHYCELCRFLYCPAPTATMPVATPWSSFGRQAV